MINIFAVIIFLLILSSPNFIQFMNIAIMIDEITKKYTSLEPVVATRSDEQKEILKIRSEIYSSLKKDIIDILDISLPLAKIYEFMEKIDELENKYKTWIPVYGHIGDGNLHAHIMKSKGWTKDMYEKLAEEIYNLTIELGGVITGEHGIGTTRVKYLKKFIDKKYLEIMKSIKKLFDPNNILNPGKVLPEGE